MIMIMIMINDNKNNTAVLEGIRTVCFFYKRYFNYKPHKQNHLTNIQPNIYKESHLSCR